MNSIDMLICIVVGLGLLWGARSGIVRQALGIAGLIAAFVLGFLFMEPVGAFVASQLSVEGQVATVAAFGAVFLAVQLAVMILIRVIQKALGALSLGALDRIVGALAGGLSAALMLSIIALFLAGFGVPSQQSREASALYGMTSELLPQAWDYAGSVLPQLEGLVERFGIEAEAAPESQP